MCGSAVDIQSQGSYKSSKTKFPDFSSQSDNISLTYIGTNFRTETP